jgi:hypothetical protein
MLTGMTQRHWSVVLQVFDAAQSSRGEPGHDDRKFPQDIHYFSVHGITWRALHGVGQLTSHASKRPHLTPASQAAIPAA